MKTPKDITLENCCEKFLESFIKERQEAAIKVILRQLQLNNFPTNYLNILNLISEKYKSLVQNDCNCSKCTFELAALQIGTEIGLSLMSFYRDRIEQERQES